MKPKNKKPIQLRDFHVVGGGCFGTQYVRWLIRAKKLGMVDYKKIIVIDRDPSCQLSHEDLAGGDVEICEMDWVEYFSEFLIKNINVSEARADHWVPAPISPHILFLGFLKAAMQITSKEGFDEKIFKEEVPTPVQIPLKEGTFAVSFAEWQCPVNCIEPPNCPAIHAERTWDMKPALEKYFLKQGHDRSSHVLQCQHLVHGVGTIPFTEIFSEFNSLLKNIETGTQREMALATVSGCHGLIGLAKVGD